MTSWFRRYLLPGFVLQSICIVGGYGTGRELAEFFLRYGPVGGLLGMLPAALLVSIACMLAFELARMFQKYDYRGFLQILLGRGWFLYEIAYLVAILLILAVVGSATGTIFADTFDLPGVAGTLLLLAVVALLVFKGTRVIESVMSVWSFVLYGVYLALFLLSFYRFGPEIRHALSAAPLESGWLLSGTRYGSLQLAMLPAVLFATTHIRRRREALIAGAVAGPILMLPAAMFFTGMLVHYPAILDQPVPVSQMLQALDSRALLLLFPIVLFGTFIETGTGMIHAFNERLAAALKALGRRLPDPLRPAIASALIAGALVLSRWGIIDLIAHGYGAMTWVFMLVLVVPLLTIGAWKVLRSPARGGPA